MVDVYRSACLVAPDCVAPRLLTLHQRVVAGLAHRLDVIEVEEERLIALVRPLVVGNRCAAMMPVALYDDAAAALAGVEVTEEGLLPDAVWAAPASITVERAVLPRFR